MAAERVAAQPVDCVCLLLQEADGLPRPDPAAARRYPWHHVDGARASRYRRLVHARYRNIGTWNLYLSLLRELVRECHRAELIDARRLEAVLGQLPTKLPFRTTRGRRLTDAELTKLLTACVSDTEPRRATRDAAIIAVRAGTGIRCSDLIDLDLADWNPRDASLYLACTKNGRSHLVYLPAAAVGFPRRWLAERGTQPGPLFTKVIGAPLRPMTYATVRSMLGTRADQADIPWFGSHDFRRTLATTLLRTHDIGTVSLILGHVDVTSTAVYDLAGAEECRTAVETLPLLDVATLLADQPDVATAPAAEASR